MFEEAPQVEVICRDSSPVEFIFRGRRFRIHSVISRWHESGGWWKRLSHSGDHLTFDDQPKAIYRVEALPLGVLATFQLERDDTTGQWSIKPQ